MTWYFVKDFSKKTTAILFSVSDRRGGIHLNESHDITSQKTFMLNQFFCCVKHC